jgi:phosphoglycolate phosphatase
MRETGSEPADTLMVGDTGFDMEMARAAGVRAIGVAWGYHPTALLEAAGAETILSGFEQLLDLVAGETG